MQWYFNSRYNINILSKSKLYKLYVLKQVFKYKILFLSIK